MDNTISSLRQRPPAAAPGQAASGAAGPSGSAPQAQMQPTGDGALRPRGAPVAPSPAAEAPPRARARPGGCVETTFGLLTNLAIGSWALSAAYRAVRNPGDFVASPAHALNAVLTFNERLGQQDLHDARQAVLERFGDHIRPDSTCHGVQPQFSFQIGNAGGAYSAIADDGKPLLAVAPYHRAGTGHHAVAHELVHCYTHPKLFDTLMATEAGHELLDSLTEHLADKLPGSSFSKYGPYDRTRMSNGRNMVGAAAELEQVVGEQTLLKAMFGGDASAVTAVSRAAVELYPKKATHGAWNAIAVAGRKEGAHELAEGYLAASLIHERKLPEDGDWRVSPRAHLPLNQFSKITSAQKRQLVAQGQAARERLGPVFDQAFCNFDERAATVAMRTVRKDLLENWQRVL